jgi:hypothetical protein
MQAIDKSHQAHRRTRLGDIVSTAQPLNARIASNGVAAAFSRVAGACAGLYRLARVGM